VPLPFVAAEAPIALKGQARLGPTFREAVLMHAIGRLALHPHISNIQTSWVKMGIEGAKVCLQAGANDLGGTLMNESITRAAGAEHGEELPPDAMERLIAELGRSSRIRTTLYGDAGRSATTRRTPPRRSRPSSSRSRPAGPAPRPRATSAASSPSPAPSPASARSPRESTSPWTDPMPVASGFLALSPRVQGLPTPRKKAPLVGSAVALIACNSGLVHQ
jgi:hypothetical protein